jgi:hypothetical protein
MSQLVLKPPPIALGAFELKLCGGSTRGRLGGGGTICGAAKKLVAKPVCPTPISCSTPPEVSPMAPSLTVK